MILKVKKLHGKAKLPTKGSVEAAGWDLYASVPNEFISIPVGECVKVNTGISIELPHGTFGAIYPRSGLATKQGLRLGNCVGVIDSDYRGEVIVAIYNDSNLPRVIADGDRIAQLVVQEYMDCELKEVDELNDTKRGDGGFGSTGVK